MAENGTPAASDAAASTSAAKADANSKVSFGLTGREEELFKIAMLYCLKSGEPVIDYDKFVEHGEFNTMKTAQNTWGKIKKKIFGNKEAGAGAGSEAGAATPKTPKTPKTTSPRKRKTKDAADDDEAAAEEGTGSPKKRKTPVKKTPKKVVAKADEEEGDTVMKEEPAAEDGE